MTVIRRYAQTVIPGPNGTTLWHNPGDDEAAQVQDLGHIDGYRYVLTGDTMPPQPDTLTLEDVPEPPVQQIREQSSVLNRQDEHMVQVRQQLRGVYGVTLGDFIEIEHKQFANGLWGWRAVMRVQSPDFDPGVRAVAIYADAEHQQYLYTTGAFTLQDGEWATEWNEGRPEKADVHYATIYASLPETVGTLRADEDSKSAFLIYKVPNAAPPVGEQWIDTGATVTDSAGQLHYLSAPIDTLGLTVGQAIKLGDAETTYISTWPGTDNLMEINPYVAASVGAKVWKWA